MKKVFFKGISLLTSMVLLFSILTISGLAASPDESSDPYKVTYTATPIVDYDGLLALVKAQNFSRSNDETNQNVVTQLTEVREYASGAVEKDYLKAGIVTTKDFTGKDSEYFTDYNYLVFFYYTVRSEGGAIGADYTYRVNKLVTQVTKTRATSTTVTYLRQGYRCSQSIEDWDSPSYNNSIAGANNQSFTLNSKYHGYYVSHNNESALQSGVVAEFDIELSNGEYATFHIIAWY